MLAAKLEQFQTEGRCGAKGADGISLSKLRYVGLKKVTRKDAIGHPISVASDDATTRAAEEKVCR